MYAFLRMTHIDDFWWWSHELNAFFSASHAQLAVLGQEPVTRMNSIHIVLLGDLDQVLYVQIASHRRSVLVTNLVGLVCTEPVREQPICRRINSYLHDSSGCWWRQVAAPELYPAPRVLELFELTW